MKINRNTLIELGFKFTENTTEEDVENAIKTIEYELSNENLTLLDMKEIVINNGYYIEDLGIMFNFEDWDCMEDCKDYEDVFNYILNDKFGDTYDYGCEHLDKDTLISLIDLGLLSCEDMGRYAMTMFVDFFANNKYYFAVEH